MTGHNWGGQSILISFRINDDGTIDEQSCTVSLSTITKPKNIPYHIVNNYMDDAAIYADANIHQNNNNNNNPFPIQHEYNDTTVQGRRNIGFHFHNMFHRLELFRQTRGGQEFQQDFPSFRFTVHAMKNRYRYDHHPVLPDPPRPKQMVAECMIAANYATATFCRQNDIQLLFRGTGTLSYRTRYSLYPIQHYHMNLQCYTTVTSPIRRGIDFLNHLYLKAGLHFIQQRNNALVNQNQTQLPVNVLDDLTQQYMNRLDELLGQVQLNRHSSIRYATQVDRRNFLIRAITNYNDEWLPYQYLQQKIAYRRHPPAHLIFQVYLTERMYYDEPNENRVHTASVYFADYHFVLEHTIVTHVPQNYLHADEDIPLQCIVRECQPMECHLIIEIINDDQ
jgi:hypothetical protein